MYTDFIGILHSAADVVVEPSSGTPPTHPTSSYTSSTSYSCNGDLLSYEPPNTHLLAIFLFSSHLFQFTLVQHFHLPCHVLPRILFKRRILLLLLMLLHIRLFVLLLSSLIVHICQLLHNAKAASLAFANMHILCPLSVHPPHET